MNSEAALWGTRVAEAAPLPDKRLNKRLAGILAAFASDPEGSIPRATGDWASAKGTYRFLENRRVIDADLLAGVARHTASLALPLDEILLVQDSSTLNFSRLDSVAELGPIDSGGLARGLLFHSCLAIDPAGMVLGLLDLQVWTRPPKDADKPEEKESLEWLHGIERSRQVLGEAASARLPD